VASVRHGGQCEVTNTKWLLLEEIMELYHGTIREYARHILKEGLRPHPENAFHVNYIPIREDRVYLAKTLYNAQVFARIRAMYEAMQPGERHPFLGMFGFVPLHKREDAQEVKSNIDKTPVVITFDVKELGKWGRDNDSLSPDDESCMCTIPPQKIKEVLELHGDKWEKVQ
jgi:RNA:NAD 2'-phosphotransferase (TPT1/KptA family)